MAHVIQELFIGLDARAALPGMLAAVEDWRPDLIVRETCEFASCVAAERFDVPLAQVGIHLDARTDADPRLLAIAAPALRGARPRGRRRHRTRPVLTCSAFGDAPARVHRFRASNGTRRRTRATSSTSPSARRHPRRTLPEPLPRRDRGARGLPVLLTIGDRRDPAELGPLPRRVRVERWVDQDEVMPRAAAVVGHGGSGSTLTALAAGVPLALIPLFVDGPENARRVADAGAGLVVEDATATRHCRRDLLDDSSYATPRAGSRTRSARCRRSTKRSTSSRVTDRRAARRSASSRPRTRSRRCRRSSP